MINIRASSLPSYSDCPRRAATSIIPDLIKDLGYDLRARRNNIGAIVGDGIHEGARVAMSNKILGVIVSLDDVKDASIDKIRKSIKASEDIVWDNTTINTNDAEKQAITISNSFYNEIFPNVAPHGVEIYRVAQIKDGFTISGHLDVETDDAQILDWKTSLRLYHSQYGTYSLLRKSNGYCPPKNLKTIHLPRVPIKKIYPGASIIDYPVDVCERDAHMRIKYVIRDIENFQKIKKPSVFMANPMSMMCGAKYCPAYNTDWCEITKQ